MKLLVVSHACVTPINQSFYVDVARITGWEIELVIPSSWESEYKSVQASRWKDFTGPIHTIPTWKSGNIPLHIYKKNFAALFRKVRPDAIYVHHEPYGLATMQIYLANRQVNNRPIGFYAAQNILKQYPVPFRWFERYVMNHSAFSFPVTQGALDVLRAKGFQGSATVLPLPIDSAIYRPRVEWAESKRVELGIAADEFVVGYLGRLVEEKGLRSMMHALSQLNDKHWRCVLVGSGRYEAELRRIASELNIADRILYVGFVPHEEAPSWLTLFDVLMLPSETRGNWKEQFGRVIVEANACETAVIGTESGEIGNVIRDTGGGLVVEEANVAQLAEAMTRFQTQPEERRRLALVGAETARRRYDQAHLAAEFATAITDAMPAEKKV
jgi:glycosyltransferase involved in cell wall biosynthesis